MNNQIMFEVDKILMQRKIDASIKAKENEIEALSIAGVKNLDTRRKELIVFSAQAMFEGKDPSAFKKELLEVEQSENALLAKKRMTIADFESNSVCNDCKDTGYSNGKICKCAKQIASKLLLEKSGFKKVLSKFSESKFEIFGKASEKTKDLFGKMQKWVKNEETPIRTILFAGGTGTGKTFLMECMADELIKNGKLVFFTTAFNLIQSCLKFHTAFSEDKVGLLDPFLESDVLFIDDLGTEPMLKNITIEYLLMILNERISANKKTVISTNLSIRQIEEIYDERIFSRVFNKKSGFAFQFEGKDLRLVKPCK